MQKNNKCVLCCDKDETINHTREYSNFVQKENKTRRNWVGKDMH